MSPSPSTPAEYRRSRGAASQGWFLRIPYSQPGKVKKMIGGKGAVHGLRLSTTVPQEITTVPTGPEVPSLVSKAAQARIETPSVSPNRLEKTSPYYLSGRQHCFNAR